MKHKHRPCPCGCGELADECMRPSGGLNAFRISHPAPNPRCVCCGRAWPTPTARVERGQIHFDCWDEHHSDLATTHDCKADN